MNAIIVAVVSVTSIGLISAVVISVVHKLMYVKVDERVAQILECLPGANCGACGYAGCSGYADALSAGNIAANLCTPGGKAVAEKVSAVLGIEVGDVVPKVAVVHCRGDLAHQVKKMEYVGVQSCMAAKQLFGGEGACTFGCIGYGDCQAVCPVDAICMDDSLARVKTSLCIGCGLCAKACPNNVISIENADTAVFVLCKSIEKGAVVRKKCTSGCIGCSKCVKECPATAIALEDNLARIDSEKCASYRLTTDSSCRHCAEVCTTKCIATAM